MERKLRRKKGNSTKKDNSVFPTSRERVQAFLYQQKTDEPLIYPRDQVVVPVGFTQKVTYFDILERLIPYHPTQLMPHTHTQIYINYKLA